LKTFGYLRIGLKLVSCWTQFSDEGIHSINLCALKINPKTGFLNEENFYDRKQKCVLERKMFLMHW
jgi:hypothetical protein